MAICDRASCHCGRSYRVTCVIPMPDSEQGTLCVMAMMFNICALSSEWQQPVQTDGRRISLPAW